MKEKAPRRAAPRRKVIQVLRTGHYPNVQWLHRLECGHTEPRKRKAPADEVGCTTCLATSKMSGKVDDSLRLAEFDEVLYAGTRAELAARLQCDQSAIRIQVEPTGAISGVYVFLTPKECERLLGR